MRNSAGTTVLSVGVAETLALDLLDTTTTFSTPGLACVSGTCTASFAAQYLVTAQMMWTCGVQSNTQIWLQTSIAGDSETLKGLTTGFCEPPSLQASTLTVLLSMRKGDSFVVRIKALASAGSNTHGNYAGGVNGYSTTMQAVEFRATN